MIELDRHLEILLLGNDCVIVPNFGGFMAHHIEARKDGVDGMLLPPARSIGFNPKLTINDSLLAQSYVEAYDISYPEALVRIGDEVRELRQHLENDGSYELHGIGVITLNEEGHYVFEPCEAGVLTPSLYGLSGFEMLSLGELDERLKRHSDCDLQKKQLLDIDKTLEDGVGIDKGADTENDAGNNNNIVMLWRTVAAACVAALAFLLYPSSLDNNSQLLTAGAINVELLQRVLPITETASATNVASEGNGMQQPKENTWQAQAEKKSQTPREGYVIVLASRVTRRNAMAYVEKLKKQGYAEAKVVSTPHNTKVIYGFYVEQEEACHALSNFRKKAEFAEAWIMKNISE